MPDEVEDVPFAFQELLHQVFSRPAGDPLEIDLAFMLERIDALVDAVAFLDDVELRPFAGRRIGDHAEDAQRSLDAHAADAAGRLEIAHDGAREADEARHVVFVVEIFPGQSGEIGRFDAQLDPQILCCALAAFIDPLDRRHVGKDAAEHAAAEIAQHLFASRGRPLAILLVDLKDGALQFPAQLGKLTGRGEPELHLALRRLSGRRPDDPAVILLRTATHRQIGADLELEIFVFGNRHFEPHSTRF